MPDQAEDDLTPPVSLPLDQEEGLVANMPATRLFINPADASIPSPSQTTPPPPPPPAAAPMGSLEELAAAIAAAISPSILGPRPQPAPRRRGRRLQLTAPRRSERLARKNGGIYVHSMTKAQRVTMRQLGVIKDENRVEEDDSLRYLDLFKEPLAPVNIQALAALCCLEVPDDVQPPANQVA
ncbi:hypothetical protein E2562_011394 [Oryza meyeriana var. granulata]|uniref:Uncharacterized protein n=1 Tax=Oryza meyeriana var. granulata TaxID=110450 RepID=A0A6G1EA82_9ORYZ|nr:hypothetical protein E2562_011394 [Oryza meyeriana var. granulata]